ncbi:MAG: methionyl-tRNA formyltransferase [Solirubrobacteraceae bacterium]|nr:methionyl-tRNA formyltransferase [Solirubrobacteraceae bacterium]
MPTVYLGTSEFAAAVLDRLAGSAAHRPSLVVTRPDRPKGRGRKLQSPPVADTARALGIALAQPDDVNAPDAVAQIAAEAPTAVIVCAFGALLKEPLLSDFELVNVHPSLLPRWRGAAPVERAMMAGDERTGVAIMRVTAGLDSGPVYAVAEEPIAPDDTYGTLAPRLEELAGDLLLDVLDRGPEPVEQTEDGVTYAEKITAEDRTIDPYADPLAAERTVRALSPHIGARLPLPSGDMLGVLRARADGDAPGGEGLRARDGRLFAGGLELLEIQPPGKRPMDAASYVRGHDIPEA